MTRLPALTIPRWLLVPAALGALLVAVPVVAMALTVDWREFWPLVTSEASTDALWLSLRTASVSTLLCLLFGIPLAVVLALLFGYALTMRGVLRAGLGFRAALGVALAADTVSITVMEILDNAVMLTGGMG